MQNIGECMRESGQLDSAYHYLDGALKLARQGGITSYTAYLLSSLGNIYTEKKESKDWILQNDLYFNLNTCNEEMSENEINLIRQVDEAKLTPDKHIETKYGLGTIRNLSSGCKTLLNIVKHPDKVVCVEECGPNVLKFIFAMDDIKIYMSRPTLAEIPDNVEIRFNDKDIVTGNSGYNAWWSKEYERREADDL